MVNEFLSYFRTFTFKENQTINSFMRMNVDQQ